MSNILVEKIGDLIAQLHEVKTYAAGLEDAVTELKGKTDNRKKLRPFEVSQMRRLYAKGSGGVTQRELAELYQVNPATVSRTVRGIYN